MKTVTKLLACTVGLFAASQLHAQTVVSDPVGFYKVTIPVGANIIAPPMPNLAYYRGVFTGSTAGSNVTFSAPGWTVNQFGPVTNGGFKRNQYVLMVRTTAGGNAGDWWKIESNTADTVTVDALGEDLTANLVAGSTLEIRKMTSIADMLGAAGTASPATSVMFPQPTIAPVVASGDIVRFLNGTGFAAQQVILTTSGTPGFYNYRIGAANWTNGSQITIEPDDAIVYFRKVTEPATNMVSLGQVQTAPLTHYINPGGYVFSSPFAGAAPWGPSGLSNSVGLVGGATIVPSTARDVFRRIDGTGFAAQQVLWYTGAPTAGIPTPPSFIVGATPADSVAANQLTPGKAYVALRPVGSVSTLIWRQSVPYTP